MSTGWSTSPARLLPAALLQAAATTMRATATDTGRVALDAALDALALLRAADEAGRRSVVLPFGLIGDPSPGCSSAPIHWRRPWR